MDSVVVNVDIVVVVVVTRDSVDDFEEGSLNVLPGYDKDIVVHFQSRFDDAIPKRDKPKRRTNLEKERT